MGTTYMNFGTGVFHVDGDGPLTQAQVDSVWRNLPTTGASWVERGQLFVQQYDGAPVVPLGPVERGVKGVSDKVRLGSAHHATRSRHHAMKKKSPAQLDREIAEVLGKPRVAARAGSPNRSHHAVRVGTAKAGKMPDPKKTLKEIVAIAFPNYKGRKIRLEEATHVDRQVEGGGTFYRDFLVGLYPRHVQPVEQPHAFRGSGNKSTEIPFGFAYVSQGVFQGSDSGIRIYLPPIDAGSMSVAVDAMLAAGGKITPAVLSTIEHAIGHPGSTNLHRDAYVALVAQRAGELSSGEASASYG